MIRTREEWEAEIARLVAAVWDAATPATKQPDAPTEKALSVHSSDAHGAPHIPSHTLPGRARDLAWLAEESGAEAADSHWEDEEEEPNDEATLVAGNPSKSNLSPDSSPNEYFTVQISPIFVPAITSQVSLNWAGIGVVGDGRRAERGRGGCGGGYGWEGGEAARWGQEAPQAQEGEEEAAGPHAAAPALTAPPRPAPSRTTRPRGRVLRRGSPLHRPL